LIPHNVAFLSVYPLPGTLHTPKENRMGGAKTQTMPA